jgi:hypothetical protein
MSLATQSSGTIGSSRGRREGDEHQFAEYDHDSDDGGIVPEAASPIIAVKVMYESEEC